MIKRRNTMNELMCKECNDVTIMCDEGVTAVTCGKCVIINMMECCDE